ncbi:MAG: hypothetical protein IKA36_01980 [Clostridia bacterium]|nr:hypothetical protein [Clostridia bacterium]
MSTQTILDDCNYLIGKAINNSKNFLSSFQEFTESRSFESLRIINPNLFEELIKQYNHYILGNGLFIKRLMRFPMNEYQSFCFNILTRNPQKYKNHWYTYISNYIFSKYDEDISSIRLEDLKNITNYYDGGLSKNIKKYITPPPTIDREIKNNIKHMKDFIKIGECCKYDVKGFFDNELLYLLCGLCINEGIRREFKTFYGLFDFVKSYLQLWQFNKIFDSACFERENHNLVTHIKSGGHFVKRYRKCAKYFKHYGKHSGENEGHTKYIENENEGKIYIETKYNSTELNNIWKKLEELYGSNQIIDLYYIYVTSQLLTRSSCLSALIILNILWYKQNKKFIQVNKDEQLDWLAISCGIEEFKSTIDKYIHEVELNVIDMGVNKVSDVLNYTHYYIAANLSK